MAHRIGKTKWIEVAKKMGYDLKNPITHASCGETRVRDEEIRPNRRVMEPVNPILGKRSKKTEIGYSIND